MDPIPLNRTVQNIFNICPRKANTLREACKTAQDTIRDSPIFSSSPHDVITDKDYEYLANKIFIPCKLALETKDAKLVFAGLDGLEKLLSLIIKPQLMDLTSPPVSNGVIGAPAPEGKKLVETVVDLIGSYFDFQDQNVQLSIIKTLLAAVITPTCGIHDTCLMGAIRSCYNIYLVCQNKNNIMAAKSTLFQMVDSILQRFDKSSFDRERLINQKSTNNNNNNNNHTNTTVSTGTPTKSNNNHQLDKDEERIIHNYNTDLSDVILLFRAFCKLSKKDVPVGAALDSHEMKSKLLSLELLQRILENPLPSLKMSEKFINSAIKRYLSISLLANGSSSNLMEFKITLQIFLSLIIHFKEHLKEEIGQFFSKVILETLSSQNNPQTIADIFVNYDRDPEHKDIFERMVYELSKVAQGASSGQIERSPQTSAEDTKFKTLGLECIVTIMKSLVDWSKEIYDENKRIEKQREVDLQKEEQQEKDQQEIEEMEKLQKKIENQHPLRSSIDEKQKQQFLEQGKSKFNSMTPNKGIDFLIQCGYLKENPIDVALFLKNQSDLIPKKISQYLLLPNSFNINILYKYIDLFDFKKMEIDQALKSLLSSILINGHENNSMDRLIEKFAEKYFSDNQSEKIHLLNAESAYLLSYSIIILTSDLRNPSIITKITKEAWLKMNSKQNNKKDFDEQYLLAMYDRMALESFILFDQQEKQDEEDNTTGGNGNNNNNNNNNGSGYVNGTLRNSASQERLLRFNKEGDYIVEQCQKLIKSKLEKKSKFYRARNIEHVSPMFISTWCYVLSTLSVILDESKDRKIIQLCLDGLSYAVRVSCIFYLNVERSSFITSLSKLCLLDSAREISIKNIDCIKALVQIGTTEGNYLQDSWTPILKTICILERLHLINDSQNTPPQHSAQPTNQPLSNQKALSPTVNFPSVVEFSQNSLQNKIRILVEEYPKDTVFDSIQIERIFTNTIYLSDDSIITFIKCLVEVSEEEINHYSRIYSVMKLVEVIEYNLKRRIRLVFYNMWEIAVSHFIRVGQHNNNDLALHAIDSLRQLANKYLEREEMSNYNFQNEFLMPFETVMSSNNSVQIRELIIRCVGNLIQSKSQNIKSGWKTILNVLSLGSTVPYEPIVVLAFQIVESITQPKILSQVPSHHYQDLINCIGRFAAPAVHFNEISLKAVNILDQLTRNQLIIDSAGKDYRPLILKALITPITHDSESVRSLSSSMLFSFLQNLSTTFTQDTWSLIINELIKIIKKIINSKKALAINDFEFIWVKQTCPSLLNDFINLFYNHHDQLINFYPILINLFESFVYNLNQVVSNIGCEYLCKFIQKCGCYFNQEHWQQISKLIGNEIYYQLLVSQNNTLPQDFSLLGGGTEDLAGKKLDELLFGIDIPVSFVTLYNWQIITNMMQKMTHVVVEIYKQVPKQFCIDIIQYWSFIYKLAKKLDKSSFLVHQSSSSTSAPSSPVSGSPTLQPISHQQLQLKLHFETTSLSCLLEFGFEMFLNQHCQDRQNQVEILINGLVVDLIQEWNGKAVTPAPIVMIVKLMIHNIDKYSGLQFSTHFPTLYPSLIDLSLNDNAEIRSSLMTLLTRFGKNALSPIAPITTPDPLPLDPPVTTIQKQPQVTQNLFSPTPTLSSPITSLLVQQPKEQEQEKEEEEEKVEDEEEEKEEKVEQQEQQQDSPVLVEQQEEMDHEEKQTTEEDVDDHFEEIKDELDEQDDDEQVIIVDDLKETSEIKQLEELDIKEFEDDEEQETNNQEEIVDPVPEEPQEEESIL
ncbi:Arf guanyl-nucleotide exchange factor [Cavenderia fasciculata]|uniref:Arf guanyl-nucleotide exchange factor n=1 Tax=Cavenderia fasciculata TaxID=261658 RepID=F4QCB7_CACFS|nr:Arf guanyl-nucleotide exchange factor [Cavenderia fasciculata]EGG14398.1 Arf guanyl-nucleotide exchange factor [Cavenderia fasciculata]|eukprot:XP_004353807.1 Arf guanyl-nucleotide exchange factor [Cavenderia fasciculata]